MSAVASVSSAATDPTASAGCAFLAGRNGSSTPTCSSPAPEPEPTAAAGREQRRLLDLRQPEQPAVERARRILAAGRRSDLDVVESVTRCHRDARPSYSGSGFPPTTTNVSPSSPATTSRVEPGVDAEVVSLGDLDSVAVDR